MFCNLMLDLPENGGLREKNKRCHFSFICRFSEIWAPTCWRRRLRATTPACSRTVRRARGSPSPWWETLWDETLHTFNTHTPQFLMQKEAERVKSFRVQIISVFPQRMFSVCGQVWRVKGHRLSVLSLSGERGEFFASTWSHVRFPPRLWGGRAAQRSVKLQSCCFLRGDASETWAETLFITELRRNFAEGRKETEKLDEMMQKNKDTHEKKQNRK